MKQPFSPQNFRIFSDNNVNGLAKSKNFIGSKYEHLMVELSQLNSAEDDSGESERVYCICRRTFDPNQNSPRFRMFQCEGPCGKWVHPFCFGHSYEQIEQILQ